MAHIWFSQKKVVYCNDLLSPPGVTYSLRKNIDAERYAISKLSKRFRNDDYLTLRGGI